MLDRSVMPEIFCCETSKNNPASTTTTKENSKLNSISKQLFSPVSIAPLVVFRILFGLMMLISVVRFWANGWIGEMYIEPGFYFPFYGFEWVQPLGENEMYLLFGIMILASLGIMLGCFYRVAAVLFFLCFTYVELIDKTNYLNHYYFVSIVSFLLIFVPANRSFSIDSFLNPKIRQAKIPVWTIWVFQFQLGIVYVFAGIAKLNPDWLFHAMPLKIWLPAQAHLPLIGKWLQYEWVAYGFSWMGAFYDLFIVFFLMHNRTRIWAYGAVIGFHLMTGYLFPIGMFPYIMIALTLVFFPASFHERLLPTQRNEGAKEIHEDKSIVQRFSEWTTSVYLSASSSLISSLFKSSSFASFRLHVQTTMLGLFIAIQLLFPFRYALYPGHLFWTEQGYRFSWRVMLMEKAGYTTFTIFDPVTGKREQARNYDYLTPNQEKMMSTQPDMIVQFAHHLKKEYIKKGFVEPIITADSYVTLNGERSKRFIDPNVDLTKVVDDWSHKSWILPFAGTKEFSHER